jgi:hypothetical protein
MKKVFAVAALFLSFFLAGCSHPRPVVVEAPPPPDFNEIARQGYHDGFVAARSDADRGRTPDIEHHPKFRNPPVAPEAAEDYRHGFRRGYNAFLHRE